MPIRVTKAAASTVSFSTPQEIIISHADDSIRVGDGTDLLAINADGSINASVSGVATAANQTTGNVSLSAIETAIESIDNKSDANSIYVEDSIDGNGDYLEISCEGYNTVLVLVGSDASPTFPVVSFQGTLKGDWTDSFGISGCNLGLLDGELPVDTTSLGIFSFNVSGLSKFRLLASDDGEVPVKMRAVKNVSVINQIQAYTFIKPASSTYFPSSNRMQIVEASDVTETYTYADFGAANERITEIEYDSPTHGTVTKTLNYTLDGSKYRLTTIVWS